MSAGAVQEAAQERAQLQAYVDEMDLNGKIQKGLTAAIKDTKLDAQLCLAASLLSEADPELATALTELNQLAAGGTALTKDSAMAGRFLASKLLGSPFEDADEEGRDATPSPPADAKEYLTELNIGAAVGKTITACLKGQGDVCFKIAAVLCGSGARVAVPKELVKALEKAAAGKAETAGMVRDALKKYVPKAPEPEPEAAGTGEAEAEPAAEAEAPAEAEAEAEAEPAAEEAAAEEE